MTHLNEEQLIDHYYGEATNDGVTQHLRLCRECKVAYEALARDLSELKEMPVPERDPAYGASVWSAIENKLPSPKPDRVGWRLFPARAFAFAAVAAALVVAAFMLGRAWQQAHSPEAAYVVDPNAHKLLLSVLLDEHFERAERFLTELKHADETNSNELQRQARELLAENRLYRESSAKVGGTATTHALQRLERLLAEVANQPDGLTQGDLQRISTHFDSEDLLFELRILTSGPVKTRTTDIGTTRSTI